jgi:Tol biopolymer transport system component/DNA-binding winged helix-turn-helix (wHTH) protein
LAQGPCLYEFGEFRLDANSKMLLRGSEPVHLPLKATEILLILAQNGGDVVSKERLMNAAWPNRVVDEANLKQNIAVIRRTLAIAPGMPGHIDTFVGRGYRLVGSVARAPDLDMAPSPTQPAAPSNAVPPPSTPPQGRRGAWRLALLAGFALLLAGFGFWRYGGATVSTPSTVSGVTAVTRLLGAEFQPAVSADGRKVAFVWQQQDGKPPGIWVKSLDREDPVRVGSQQGRHASPAWSPDGRSLAYIEVGLDRTDILTANSDGSGERVIARYPRSNYVFRQRLLDWSPDGRWLCLSYPEEPNGNSTLFLIDSRNAERRRLTGQEAAPGSDLAPRFSPDGSSISYIKHIGRADQELRIVPFQGGTSKRLLSDGKLISDQDWDAQGKSIVFASNRSGEFRLWRVPVNGAAAQPLEIFSEFPMDLSIARKAAVLIYSAEAEDRNIWRLDLREKNWTRVIASSAQDASPQYSPDGSRICFRSNRTGEDQLWLAEANGDHPVQLTTGDLHPNFGHWAPDGHAIVFNDHTSLINVAERRESRWLVRRLGVRGSHPVFSQDGNWIYAGTSSGILRISYGAGEVSTIPAPRAYSLAASPDGRFIYFNGENGSELWRVPTGGGPAGKVLDDLLPGCGSCWALAPNGVYYLSGKNSLDEQSLYFHDFATSESEDKQIVRYPEPLAPLGSGPFSLSPDYRYLLCVRTEMAGADLMKVEPFR